MSDKIQELSALIESMQIQLTRAKLLLADLQSGSTAPRPFVMPEVPPVGTPMGCAITTLTPPIQSTLDATQLSMDLADSPNSGSNVIEGLFDGQHMVGPDGKQYNVPANYASKSKLVEGDQMKLTIAQDGTFIYKQIGPVPRKHLTGKLQRDVAGFVMLGENGKTYKLLLASVTYFKGKMGDTVVTFVPEHEQSAWAAVEHIIPAEQATPELLTRMTGETEAPVELHQGSEGLLPSGEEGLLPAETV